MSARPTPQAQRSLPSSTTRAAPSAQPATRITAPQQARPAPPAGAPARQTPQVVPTTQARRTSNERRPAAAPAAAIAPAATTPKNTLNAQQSVLPPAGTGCMVVQLAHPRFDADLKYIVHCHIKAPSERWREFVDKSTTRDIVNERAEDKQIKFTRLELVYGHAQVLTGLQPGKYQFRIQSWPHGLLSELKEISVTVKANETAIVTAWVHSYTPVGAMNAKVRTDVQKIKGGNMPPQELLARAKARQVKLDKRIKSFNFTQTFAGCLRTGLWC